MSSLLAASCTLGLAHAAPVVHGYLPYWRDRDRCSLGSPDPCRTVCGRSGRLRAADLYLLVAQSCPGRPRGGGGREPGGLVLAIFDEDRQEWPWARPPPGPPWRMRWSNSWRSAPCRESRHRVHARGSPAAAPGPGDGPQGAGTGRDAGTAARGLVRCLRLRLAGRDLRWPVHHEVRRPLVGRRCRPAGSCTHRTAGAGSRSSGQSTTTWTLGRIRKIWMGLPLYGRGWSVADAWRFPLPGPATRREASYGSAIAAAAELAVDGTRIPYALVRRRWGRTGLVRRHGLARSQDGVGDARPRSGGVGFWALGYGGDPCSGRSSTMPLPLRMRTAGMETAERRERNGRRGLGGSDGAAIPAASRVRARMTRLPASVRVRVPARDGVCRRTGLWWCPAFPCGPGGTETSAGCGGVVLGDALRLMRPLGSGTGVAGPGQMMGTRTAQGIMAGRGSVSLRVS